MKLNKKNLAQIAAGGMSVPLENTFSLPEKVLQFGTGVLLRGLPDVIIDNANKKGVFNGRVVVVKSTTNGDTDAFDEQDGLYTVCIRGIDKGKKTAESQIISAISRVLSATTQWEHILGCATDPEMQIIISNTTELGIVLVQDNIHDTPPVSFPGKLVSFLYRRFKHFAGDQSKGMVIIPTELIPGNGEALLSIVLALANQHKLETAFTDWIKNANFFCSSLVDRIVPGKLASADHAIAETELGYSDELMIVSEVYSLWAIESANEQVKKILSFAIDDGVVVIAPDIEKFRELKLRLLNGAHTFGCALACLSGFKTVKEAMENELFSGYLVRLMHEEIAPTLTGNEITESDAVVFAGKVSDRFRNPFIEHKWLSIAAQSVSKMYLRNVATIKRAVDARGYLPAKMALGFAGLILFMKVKIEADGKYYGEQAGRTYPVTDSHAKIFVDAWQHENEEAVVEIILASQQLWHSDLSTLPGVKDAVTYWLKQLINEGVEDVLKMISKQKNESADGK